jgi:hypothetical protein
MWRSPWVVVMSAHIRAKRRLDWNIPDPKDMRPERFREVGDLIGEKVKGLLAGLNY